MDLRNRWAERRSHGQDPLVGAGYPTQPIEFRGRYDMRDNFAAFGTDKPELELILSRVIWAEGTELEHVIRVLSRAT